MKAPNTLQEAIIYFADADNCLGYIVAHRWPDGVKPARLADCADVSWLPKQRNNGSGKSAHTKRQFSAKVGKPSSRIRLLALRSGFPPSG